MTQFQGLVVAVTGGAQGIGRAIAGQLARRGARVAIGDLDLTAARQTAQELSAHGAGSVTAFPLDVTDTVSYKLFLAATEARLGPLDVLVGNAGVMWVGPLEAEPERATQAMLDVNLHGVIRGVKLAAPLMRARGRGHIVTIASAASKIPSPGEATYTATKHAVYGYLSAARLELHGSGVQLSLVLPGLVNTRLAAGMDNGPTAWVQPDDIGEVVARVIARPRFEVSFPGWLLPAANWGGVLPDYLRYAVQRRLVPDQVAASQDKRTRDGYEAATFG